MHKPNESAASQQQQQQLQQQQQQQAHIMPTPSATPWNLDAMPWKLASTSAAAQPGAVMEFDAQYAEPAFRGSHVFRKRKSDIVEPPLSTKQFISEEKITAHFNGLHISSDYIQHTPPIHTGGSSSAIQTAMRAFDAGGAAKDNESYDDDDTPSTSTATGKCFTNLTYQDYKVTAKELEEKLRKANRITMCEEIRKFHEEQKKKVTHLPESLLFRVERPCTALVPWQPPPILELLRHAGAPDDDEDQGPPNTTTAEEPCFDMEETTTTSTYDSEDIDDFIDNNNTCSVDFNNVNAGGGGGVGGGGNGVGGGMDEDL